MNSRLKSVFIILFNVFFFQFFNFKFSQKAGGDIKKGGVDPFAYMPLSQAAKNGRRGRHHIGITGKR